MPKVLIVDKSIDRKKRIAALKERGFSVFPALQLGESRSRCRPGAYDLIIVNAPDEAETAVAFCDELSERTPAQAVLMTVSNGTANLSRSYVVPDDPELLAQRAAAMVKQQPSQPQGGGEHENRDQTPDRVSA